MVNKKLELKIKNKNLRSVINESRKFRNRSTSGRRNSGGSQISRLSNSSILKDSASNRSQSLNLTEFKRNELNDDQLSHLNSEKYDSDATNSDIDANDRLLKQRFRTKAKSKFLECRKLFAIEFKRDKQMAKCLECGKMVSMSSNSDSNLRTHLAYVHGKTEYLTPGQLNRYNGNEPFNKTNIPRIEKQELDEKIVDSIIEDSRTFNDFAKKGMKKLFAFLKPGYKTPSKKFIRKMIKKKYLLSL